jgi:hypothetical protein
MSSTTKPHSLLEDSSKGRVEDPERSSRRTARHASASPKPNRPRSPQQTATSLARHARKCAICNHADRAAIDDDFVSWRSESAITVDYQLPSRSSVYRHAAATGLLQRRRLNLRGVAERILERVDEAPPTASTILRAMRIFAQITEDGQWVEPAKRSIVTHIHVTQHSNTECDSACPEERREPSAAQGRTCGPNVTKPRDEGEGPAVHVAPAGDPSSAPSAERGIATGKPTVPPVSRSATDPRTAPQHGRRTPLHLDYLPRWAAGLSDPEILIGTQNTDPETVSDGEHGN